MKTLGDDVYIQRGETWSLDFDVTNEDGDPYQMLKEWTNPYFTITVTAARYEQERDFRKTYWLDLAQRMVEGEDGSIQLEPMKMFTGTEALQLSVFAINEALAVYGTGAGGRIVLDKNSDFDVTNFLFKVDELHDGNWKYKYVKDYTVTDGAVTAETWEDYSFRIIKQFKTRDWVEQDYLFDMKILAGQSVAEYVHGYLSQDPDIDVPDLPWTDELLQEQINLISNDEIRTYVQEIYDAGMPLMPDYDTKAIILQPTKLIVSANIQGRY